MQKYTLNVMSPVLPFRSTSSIEISDFNIEPVIDLKAEDKQDKHVFFTTVGSELVKFIETSDIWAQAKSVKLNCKHYEIKKCFILSDSSTLVAMTH